MTALRPDGTLEVRGTDGGAALRRARATIVATGPLTSDALAAQIESLTGEDHLSFYDVRPRSC